MRRILGIEACYIAEEGLEVDLSQPNKYLYKGSMSDNLDVLEMENIANTIKINNKPLNIYYNDVILNALINISFTKPSTKFYKKMVAEKVYLGDKAKEENKHPIAILSRHSVKELKNLTFDGCLFKNKEGIVVAALMDVKAKGTIDGLDIDKKSKKYKIHIYKTAIKLREDFYKNGCKIKYVIDGKTEEINYLRYKRSASSAKSGQCLFIREELYEEMMKWTTMYDEEQEKTQDLMIEPNSDKQITDQLASWEAYIALSLSGIENKIRIPLNSILIVDDLSSTFKDTCILVKKEEGKNKLIGSKRSSESNNKIWDGEGLLDESIFNEYGYKDNGMLLLRNRFLKSCVFNTKLQQWFKDQGVKDVKRLRGWKIAERIEDIKLVITYSSFKLFKFNDETDTAFASELVLDEVSRWWRKYGDEEFGVVKHDKPTKFMFGKMVQANYQLLNTLPLSYDEVEKLYAPSLEFFDNFKKVEYLRLYLKMNLGERNTEYDAEDEEDDEVDDKLISFKNEVLFELLKRTDDIKKTKMYNELRQEVKRSLKKDKFKRSKILIDGNYATLFSNGYVLLQYITSRDEKFDLSRATPALKKGEIMCTRFNDGEELLCERNPHITMGNLYRAKNKYAPEYRKYFNLTDNIVCVNSIAENIMERLNGADFDSDTMLITNNIILVEAADKIKKRFPIPKVDIKEKKANKELYKIDHDISENRVGEIVNLSQTLNSLYWDIYSKNSNDPRLEQLYIEICKLAVLSNLEIDKAKKNYEIKAKAVMDDTRAKVKELFSKEVLAYQKLEGEKDDGKLVITRPSFLGDGKTPIYKTSCEYVQEIVNKIPRAERTSGKFIKMHEFFKCDCDDDAPTKEEKYIIDELENLKMALTDKKQTYQEISELIEETLDNVEENLLDSIKNKTIGKIFKALDDRLQKSDLKGTSKNNEPAESLYLLYFIIKLNKLDELLVNQEVTNLEFDDENGDIEVLGHMFKKTKKYTVYNE